MVVMGGCGGGGCVVVVSGCGGGGCVVVVSGCGGGGCMWYIYIYAQCKLLERKYGICASGWKEKHHQRKLQWVKPPRTCASGVFVPIAEGETPPP